MPPRRVSEIVAYVQRDVSLSPFWERRQDFVASTGLRNQIERNFLDRCRDSPTAHFHSFLGVKIDNFTVNEVHDFSWFELLLQRIPRVLQLRRARHHQSHSQSKSES